MKTKDKFGEFHKQKDFLDLPLLFFAPLREILFYSKSTIVRKRQDILE